MTITALPSWLDHRAAFAALAGAADGYVLQVHSLRPPARPQDPGLLCDPASARRAVETAARFGRPFRVALPTYGYLAGFTPSGRLVGLSAEGPELAWPPGTVVALARSDPAALAGLVRGWTRDRPRELAGLLWYRLPVSGDRRNWSPETFRAVRAGMAPVAPVPPRAEVRAEVTATEPLLFDLALANPSATEAPAPAALRVRWRNASLLAADGLAGYRARPVGVSELWLERPAGTLPEPVLRPGERRPVGWLRFAAPTALRVELAGPAAPQP